VVTLDHAASVLAMAIVSVAELGAVQLYLRKS
jgi:hypothetical protein